MTYKDEHEAFVSGNNGTTTFHIAVTGLACLLPVYIRDAAVGTFPHLAEMNHNHWLGFVFDFLLVMVPLQFIMSLFGRYHILAFSSLLLLLVLIFTIKLQQKSVKSVRQTMTLKDLKMGNRRPFITYYRAYANVITAFSILAVDFQVFPRYFAKVETYGTGLMDVGVGGFLITNAVVSPEARGIVATDRVLTSVLKSVKSSVPLMLLGMGRVMAVKSADYQEHVTEYGVHWNFFFTLAAVKIGCTILFCVVPPRLWNIAGVLLIAAYQHSLTFDGLKEYIIKGLDGKGGRLGLVDANREGIYSCIGFLSIYIMGVQLGKILMKKRERVVDWIKLCITLVIISSMCWVLLYCADIYVESISRRFANLAYLLWMLAFNSLLLLGFLVGDIALTCLHHISMSAHKKESPDDNRSSPSESSLDCYTTCDLINAVSYNGLFYFLFANVLTGLVNMTVRTIYQSNLVAMLILTGYMFVLSAVTYFLYKKKILLKFW